MEFFLVSYLLYSLTKNVYDNYQVDKYIEKFNEENALIEAENRQKTEDYLYFTSEEYIDKIAKQNLGRVNQGEEVIVLSPDVITEEAVEGEAGYEDVAKYGGESNFEKWVEFFFD